MHNYNVGNRYATETRVGNWYEQKELKQYEFKEYLYQKEHSNNLTLNTTAKLGFSNQPITLSPHNNGKLGLGDHLQLFNAHTQAVLAYNVNEPILGEETYAVTTTPLSQPALRNVLTIEAATENGSAVVRYGDKIRLSATVNGRKLFLQSLPVNPMRSSKFSRQQQVSMTATLSSSSLWTFQTIDAKQRFDSIGQEVPSGQPVLLKHIPTSQWLASDTVKYVNDFGVEFEVFGKSFLVNNKTQNLFAEKEGHKGATNPLRSQGIQNEWHVLKG